MIHFNEITSKKFLTEYWQKKPLVIRQALPDFINSVSPDELAGLSLEQDVESRIVLNTPDQQPYWHLKRGPFLESDFSQLGKTHWTLLVQGVDRIVPEVYALLKHFDFIPQWRFDDVMISFASLYGSVGPHYDQYDVFLYQAQGRRQWSLTTQKCTQDNFIDGLELRIMNEFNTEEQFILEEGDMLYLPAHVGHHGVALSEECMTYSFGYRSYQGLEVWDSLGDYCAEKETFKQLYQDPDWSTLKNTSELSSSSYQNAKKLMLDLLDDEQILKSWFGCFATRLDQSAEQQLPVPLEEDELIEPADFINELKAGRDLIRDACCRFAYQSIKEVYQLYINGCEWETSNVSPELINHLANNRILINSAIAPFLDHEANQILLYDLWKLQWIQFLDD